LALALLAVAGAPARAAPRRYLLAFASPEGLGEVRLRYPARDAQRVADVLVRLGGVAPERAVVLADARPADVRRALAGLARDAAAAPADDEVTVFLYFSGHGAADDLHLAGERLPVAELRGWLEAVPARLRVAVLDACRTGGFARRKGFSTAPPFDIRLAPPGGPGGTVLVRSSSDGEVAHESDRLQGAVFTHFLTSALQGAGDADGDGRVTLGEAYDFAYHRTLAASARAGAVQHAAAELFVAGAGPLVLTTLARADAALELPAGGDVRYLVFRRPGGALVAEAWSRADAPLPIALASGRYLVQRLDGPRSGAAEVALTAGAAHRLAAADFVPLPYEELAQKGPTVLVRRHELSAAGGLLADELGGLGGRLRLSYALRLAPSWALGARAVAARAWRRDAAHDVTEWQLGGALLGEWRVDLGPVALALVLGGELVWVDQRQRRRDADRVAPAGYAVERRHDGLAGGGFLEGALRVPFAARWWWELSATGRVHALREGGGPAARTGGGIETGFGVAF
jgi:hypothetical protein